jgi:hypothetical protein
VVIVSRSDKYTATYTYKFGERFVLMTAKLLGCEDILHKMVYERVE